MSDTWWKEGALRESFSMGRMEMQTTNYKGYMIIIEYVQV